MVRKFIISKDGSVDDEVAQFVKWATRIIASTFIFQEGPHAWCSNSSSNGARVSNNGARVELLLQGSIRFWGCACLGPAHRTGGKI